MPGSDPTNRGVFFAVEQGGAIRVVRDGRLAETPFLDLSADIASGGERGLLGLALAPDYGESRRFYVNFTNRDGDTVVARFVRNIDNALVADRDSRFDLTWPDGRRVIEQPFANHNGGNLVFGKDGYLYIGLGDGGSGGDPQNNAQNPQSLLGKMLRIDVSVPDTDARGYRVPDDNPFVDGDPIAALTEIWAFGLRNPWRYSFDDWTRGGTGALIIGDVGQDTREEIDFEPPGAGGRNYGWRIREGRIAYDARTQPAFSPLTEPIYDYPRPLGESITGGLFYRGAALDPRFNGRYFFADFVSGRMFSIGVHLDIGSGDASADDQQEHTASVGGRSRIGMVSSFGADHDGELLLVNYSGGSVVRVLPDFSVVPRAPELSASPGGDRVVLSWRPAPDGVASAGFDVERVRSDQVVERTTVGRTDATFDWSEGDCFRVRARSRAGGAGPPSAAACR